MSVLRFESRNEKFRCHRVWNFHKRVKKSEHFKNMWKFVKIKRLLLYESSRGNQVGDLACSFILYEKCLREFNLEAVGIVRNHRSFYFWRAAHKMISNLFFESKSLGVIASEFFIKGWTKLKFLKNIKFLGTKRLLLYEASARESGCRFTARSNYCFTINQRQAGPAKINSSGPILWNFDACFRFG